MKKILLVVVAVLFIFGCGKKNDFAVEVEAAVDAAIVQIEALVLKAESASAEEAAVLLEELGAIQEAMFTGLNAISEKASGLEPMKMQEITSAAMLKYQTAVENAQGLLMNAGGAGTEEVHRSRPGTGLGEIYRDCGHDTCPPGNCVVVVCPACDSYPCTCAEN